ncbi:MAG: NRDE family protein [Turneriella sp.]|nr:NRDE family protein [Turneriella sp.]
MCLIVLSFRQDVDYPLVLAGNRDEFYARPTTPLDWWQDHASILAGRDLTAGGTWLGVNKRGHFAAVTNYREPGKEQKEKKSRGLLVQNFLETGDAKEYAESLWQTRDEFNGYNLLFGDANSVFYYSNRTGKPATELAPGIYGLSNHLLDTPWPKVKKAKARFATTNHTDSKLIFTLLADRVMADETEVQKTGLPVETEKVLSSIFIATQGYGTRVSSHVSIDKTGKIRFAERSYDAGKFAGDREFTFDI